MLTRRKALKLSAASTLFGAAFHLSGCASTGQVITQGDIHSYTARALGMDIEMKIGGGSAQDAGRHFRKAFSEVKRLERIFNLSDSTSEISRLNRDGFLDKPSLDFTQALGMAELLKAATGGAFNVAVQPLWNLYTADDAPSLAAQAAAIEAVNGGMDIMPDRVAFKRPDMGLNLNGMAQGYFTDRAVAVLSERGVTSALVNIGAYKALGAQPDGRPWRVGIQDPDHPLIQADSVELNGKALATSSSKAGVISSDGSATHIFDPRKGTSPERYGSVSVQHMTAAYAEGLAAAFLTMSLDEIKALKAQPLWSAMSVIIIGNDGALSRV